MIMKKMLLESTLLLLVLLETVSALEWQEIDHKFEAVEIIDIVTMGEYQIASVLKSPQIYRRKNGDKRWELVFDVEQTNENDDNKSFYKFFPVKELLFGSKCGSDGDNESLISRDSGQTWHNLSPEDEELFSTICSYEFRFGDTLVGTSERDVVYASKNCGKNKDVIFMRFDEDINIVKKYNEMLFLGGWGRIYCSSDFGEKWDTLVTGLPGRTAIRDILILDSTTYYTSTDEGVYVSSNGGKNWKGVDFQFSGTDYTVLEQLTVFNSSIYGISNDKLYRLSTETGRFEELHFPVNDNTNKTKISIFQNKICIAGANGVYECDASSDQFTRFGDGIEKKLRFSLINTTDKYLYAKTSLGGCFSVLRLDLESNEWDTIFSKKNEYFVLSQNDKYLRISYDWDGSLGHFNEKYFSSDFGDTWEKRESEPNPLYNGYSIDTTNDTLYYQGDDIIQYSTDQGHSWDSIGTSGHRFILKAGPRMYFLVRISFPKSSSYRYILQYSEDNGKTLHAVTSDLDYMNSMIKAPDGTLLVAGNRKSAISNDDGLTWSIYGDSWVQGLASFYDSTVIGYSKYKAGKFASSVTETFYFSTNKGQEWSTFPSPSGEGSVSALYKDGWISRNTSTIYCSEAGHLYKIPAKALTGGVSVINTEKMTKNGQNLFVPNLTSNTIRLQLHMAKDEQYTVNLLTASGRLIQSSSGIIQSNTQAISLDRSGLSHGYYLLQLIAGDRKEVRPIILQ